MQKVTPTKKKPHCIRKFFLSLHKKIIISRLKFSRSSMPFYLKKKMNKKCMGRTPLRACSEGKWQNRVRGETASSKSYYFFSLCEFRPRLDCAVLEVLCERILDMFYYSLSLRLFFYCWSSNLLSLFCRSLIST